MPVGCGSEMEFKLKTATSFFLGVKMKFVFCHLGLEINFDDTFMSSSRENVKVYSSLCFFHHFRYQKKKF